MVQNKEEWSRLIGYGSGLERVKFSLTKPEWAAPALGFRGKWGDKEQLASLEHCSTRWVLLVVCRAEKLLFSWWNKQGLSGSESRCALVTKAVFFDYQTTASNLDSQEVYLLIVSYA